MLKTARRSRSKIPFPVHQLAGKSDSLDTVCCVVDSSFAWFVVVSSAVILGLFCSILVLRTECEFPQARYRKKIPARKATIIGTGMLGRRRLSDSMVNNRMDERES